jgi:inositol-1,4,5-trisphosphate 5-phosphatase
MEELENPDSYMDSRCPAWCDRIIFNKTVQDYLKNYSNNLDYGMIGQGVCMGDHKVRFKSQ